MGRWLRDGHATLLLALLLLLVTACAGTGAQGAVPADVEPRSAVGNAPTPDIPATRGVEEAAPVADVLGVRPTATTGSGEEPVEVSPTPLSPTATTTPLPADTPTEVPTIAPPSPTATATEPPQIQLMAVGDVMLARSIGERVVRDGPGGVFAGVESVLSSADLLVANLECAISERGVPQPKAYTFRAPPAAADALASVGVDLVSLANNHALDYGAEGLFDTLQLLAERQIVAAGAGQNAAAARAPVVIERNGLRVAFLAYVDVPVESRSGFDTRSWTATDSTPGVAWANADDIRADVAVARSQADLVVVLMHFGWEGRTEPNDTQRAQSHAAIDAGAALVLGSHPHVLQPVEQYGSGLIVYSLGNFVFDGFEGVANQTAIFRATLTAGGVADYELVPVHVVDGLPQLAP